MVYQTYLSLGISNQVNTNWAVQPQKLVRGLKFGIEEVEELIFYMTKNKGADQLRSYRTVNLLL